MNQVRASWTKFLELSGSERVAVFEAVGMLSLVRLRLRAFGSRRAKRWATVSSPRGHPSGGLDTARLADLVEKVSRVVPWNPNCLDRSVSLQRMLARRGVASDLLIGVRRRNDFEFHAWVEIDGVIVNDSPDVRSEFEPFQGRQPPDHALFS